VIRDHLTTGQVAEIYGKPDWLIRRVVDGLSIDIPRAGQYRLIPREALGRIGAELDKRSTRAKREPATS
jgi:hypothetical protein